MTLKEALNYCRKNKDVVARRPCWIYDNLKSNEGIFWNEKEGAFCYYYFIDPKRLVELPRGWLDNPRVGVVVSVIGLEDALAEDWILLDILSWNEIKPEPKSEFEDDDHFAGNFWADDPYSLPRDEELWN